MIRSALVIAALLLALLPAAEAKAAHEGPSTSWRPPGTPPLSDGETADPVPGALEPAPSSGQMATTRPVGARAISDAEAAARVRRSAWEPRPGNTTANNRTPTQAELDKFRAATRYPATNAPVTGAFTGTTDEIIQWAAWKWGIDENVLRGQAVQESWWDQTFAGDGGVSYGLFQIKSTEVPETLPLSRASTAFNADYYAAQLRWCYDGKLGWLNTVERGREYVAGDIWGCLGAWYSGRWYTPSAIAYIEKVKEYVAVQRWTLAGF